MEHSMCRPNWKISITLKGEGKKFQIVSKGDEKKYKMTAKFVRSVFLQGITMIDLATGWIEIHNAQLAQTDLVANQVELAWLTSYPLPNKVIVDRGNILLAKYPMLR